MGFEEDDRADAGTTPLGVLVADPRPDEGEVQLRFEPTIGVVLRRQLVEGSEHRPVEPACLLWSKHGEPAR